MHAVVVQVDFVHGREGQQEAELDFLTSMLQGVPGFLRGTWLADETRGLTCLVFETEEAARAVAGETPLPPDASVMVRAVDVYRVARDISAVAVTR